MHRNLDRRVEALVRVADPAQQAELLDLIDLAMDEGTVVVAAGRRRHLDQALTGTRPGTRCVDLQQHLIDSLRGRAADG